MAAIYEAEDECDGIKQWDRGGSEVAGGGERRRDSGGDGGDIEKEDIAGGERGYGRWGGGQKNWIVGCLKNLNEV